MALFIKQDLDERSELQNNIAAELNRRARETSQLQDQPDGVNDSQYIKDTKNTTSLAWVWIIILFLVVGISIWLIVNSMAR
ncbi:MAG: hypothetical protein WCP11_01810 [Candidatus Saccharibacteria bacterium]